MSEEIIHVDTSKLKGIPASTASPTSSDIAMTQDEGARTWHRTELWPDAMLCRCLDGRHRVRDVMDFGDDTSDDYLNRLEARAQLLERYGQHDKDCEWWSLTDDVHHPCTCGFTNSGLKSYTQQAQLLAQAREALFAANALYGITARSGHVSNLVRAALDAHRPAGEAMSETGQTERVWAEEGGVSLIVHREDSRITVTISHPAGETTATILNYRAKRLALLFADPQGGTK